MRDRGVAGLSLEPSRREMLGAVREPAEARGADEILDSIRVGDRVAGTIVEITRSRAVVVRLDGNLSSIVATVRPLELSWRLRPDEAAQVGRRVVGEVIDVDREESQIRLSLAATENPRLWAFLKGLRPGDVLAGVVADVQRFGVFVALDDGPAHPVYAGVGFIAVPDLSWRHFETMSEIIEVGQRVNCAVLYFDTWNGEARLSLRALQPDPLREFAAGAREGQLLRGVVTKLLPFGAFVRIADGVEGLVPLSELAGDPVTAPEQVVQVGDRIDVVVTRLELERRRLSLSHRSAHP